MQRGPAHAKEGCGSVVAGNPPDCFLESGNDFLPLGFFESRPQLPVAVTADWRRSARFSNGNGLVAKEFGSSSCMRVQILPSRSWNKTNTRLPDRLLGS